MKAIILLSGGLDSTVMLALALSQGKECHALTFDYGQRHLAELDAAKNIAKHYSVPQHLIKIDPKSFSKSALVTSMHLPKDRTPEEIATAEIPSSYVPARNTLFLSYAIGQAEINHANEIHIGINAMDYGPYPDCRPEYIKAFQEVTNLATKQAVKGHAPRLITPLIEWNKKEIVKQGIALEAPLDMTFSCYDPSAEGAPCQRCDACVLRAEAFATQ